MGPAAVADGGDGGDDGQDKDDNGCGNSAKGMVGARGAGGSHFLGSVIGSRLTEEIQIAYTVCQLRQLCSHCFVSVKAPLQRPPEHFSQHWGQTRYHPTRFHPTPT